MRIARHTHLFLLTAAALVACSPDAQDGATSGFSSGSGGTAGSSGKGGDGDGDGDGDGGDTTLAGPTTDGAGGGGASDTGGGPPCAAGTIVCEGNTKQVCDGDGGFTDVEDCSPGACVSELGCTVCAPNSGTCNGNVSTVCRADGSGFEEYVCDPEQGVSCDPQSGHCMGACAPQLLGTSYIGCDYFPTVTLNSALGSFPSALGTFAVAVANTSAEPTNVQVHRGATLVINTAIAANSVQIIGLPWVNELKNGTTSQLLADGAYRLRTTRPVTVYQYNPLEYSTGGGNTYTNDASLLLPANAWTGNYRVASRNAWRTLSGFYAVTASQDGTTVTLSPSATTAVNAGGGANADGTGTILLNEGDVLQVVSATNGAESQATDLTGSLVSADKPVQVIGGHDCTNVPFNIPYCDHIEESMPPIETLTMRYIVTPPQRANGGTDAEYVRVIAIEPATSVTYDPPQAGAPASLANAGDFFEIAASSADFLIMGDKPILVAQYMQGQGDSGVPGDPAEALAVSVDQYRSSYLFHAPTNYLSNFVNITAPTAAVITLDGVAVAGFTPIGASGFSVARVQLNNGGDGNHNITGTMPFGISVYGYGDDTSYWYPGGLDLDKGTN
jgi:hypothetical protein